MEQEYRTAMQAGHDSVYHYEKFCPEWLTITLRDQKIHCSNPANLNDPWDCRPWYDARANETPEAIEQFIAWAHSIADPPGNPEQEEQLAVYLRTIPAFRKDFLDGFSLTIHAIIKQRRIYCVTPDPLSILMWSHYAGNHHGICLEFGTGNSLFAEAKEVVYRSDYPRWVPQDIERIAHQMFLTKSDAWHYEHEFRIIAGFNYPKLDGEYLHLPPAALQAIIVGCEADYKLIRNIVTEHAAGLPVKRIVRTPNHYSLTIGESAAD